ncbi:cytosol aminopeptidase family, catalytic domain-domain-containing protein [Protomyces lactucae-debilis]|uniref:Cytosol aminopeptidase family, catalytic domain-domain-containing protein n=1 Tax=Protomyces lactucae-debilis TaxID=2754530 RepID=A0A1Y2FAJ7_PROLT|nr:cytosol aminopeptidase family, catalytic domain-containing protein [Protomyces lactucae-debilis]ORY80913.1 cytosol aminopeptidase family, catalytic domain-domain-containing protein [Protomyces lactucae-debilis]
MLSFSAFKLSSKPLLLVGEKSRLSKDFLVNLLKLDDKAAARLSLATKAFTANATTVVEHESGTDQLVKLAYLSNETSRYMGIIRADLIPKLVSSNLPDSDQPCQVVMCLKNKAEVFAASSAVAKAFPLYTKRSANLKKLEAKVDISFLLQEGEVTTDELDKAEKLAENVRLTQSLVDTPPTDLNPEEYGARIAKHIEGMEHVTSEFIVGEELKKQGMEALYSVGKAAIHPARMIVLKYETPQSDKSKAIAFVGKGITYDTGGLSIKTGGNMCNMKTDMGGSAACLGAFTYLWSIKYPHPVYATLCIAENAVGPGSLKNDDIIRAKSGKTIEINNTDAEGRLVLADGVAFSGGLKPSVMLSVATLTGAQMVAAGQLHAGVLAPTYELERELMDAGVQSGDLTTPLVYAPVLMEEFKSEVADMKNSVANRMNAQASCAGHFIEQHVPEDCLWAHIDMAGPSTYRNGCATGYGVGLLAQFALNRK